MVFFTFHTYYYPAFSRPPVLLTLSLVIGSSLQTSAWSHIQVFVVSLAVFFTNALHCHLFSCVHSHPDLIILPLYFKYISLNCLLRRAFMRTYDEVRPMEHLVDLRRPVHTCEDRQPPSRAKRQRGRQPRLQQTVHSRKALLSRESHRQLSAQSSSA